MHISQQKEQLRRAIADRIARMTEEERGADGRTICHALLPRIPRGSAVAVYVPLADEADIRALLQELLDRGDPVFLPRYSEGELAFHRVRALDGLAPGAFGIPEPPREAEALDPHALAVALVPGRAFDRSGNRLGRGRGGYERWIAGATAAKQAAHFIGVCLTCQIVPAVPAEAHDEKMDVIETGSGPVYPTKNIA